MVVAVALAAGAPTAAQQILEVDFDVGREVAGGEEYMFSDFTVAVDYDRRLVLVSEAAEPLGVNAYSLDDGSVQHVFGGGRPGDGPGEIRKVHATAVGPDGVFVAGPGRVIYWSWSGALLHQWTPKAPDANVVCALSGRPAVTTQEGVVSLPTELADLEGYTSMFLADDGRLVVTTYEDELGGVVMDLATGCYALLPSVRRVPGNPKYVGMFADTVVTLEASRKPTTRMMNGRQVSVYYADPSYIFVRPVRAVAGESCS